MLRHQQKFMIKVRPAKLSDAKELSELVAKIFRDTFADQSSVEDMEIHCQSTYGEKIQFDEIASHDCITLVADDSGQLVAYAQLRWGSHPECVSDQAPLEVQRLYVDKSWHGKGVAHDLMQACLDIIRDRKGHIAWLGVWENNSRAISFYKKYHFQEVGDQVFLLGHDAQRDIIMELHIAGSGKNA